jgi:hypothetical protein
MDRRNFVKTSLAAAGTALLNPHRLAAQTQTIPGEIPISQIDASRFPEHFI